MYFRSLGFCFFQLFCLRLGYLSRKIKILLQNSKKKKKVKCVELFLSVQKEMFLSCKWLKQAFFVVVTYQLRRSWFRPGPSLLDNVYSVLKWLEKGLNCFDSTEAKVRESISLVSLVLFLSTHSKICYKVQWATFNFRGNWQHSD